tara:strand:+ start:1474 stop:2688 length:1215 start_codon:yes stop_codon:yes gene_type:complete
MEIDRGFKQTEAGIIPIDWECKSLGSITTRIGDGLHGTPNYSSNGNYSFINGNNLVEGKIEVAKETMMVDYSEFQKNNKFLSDKSILISINGTIGNLALYNGEKIMLGKSAAYLNLQSEICRKFIYYSLQTQNVIQKFFYGLTGSTIGNLGLTTIRQTYIALPSKKEQQAIALTLNDVDLLLNKIKRLILKKIDFKQAVMQNLLTGNIRLPGFNKSWVKKKIGEIYDYVDGVRTTGGDKDYIEIGDIDVQRKSYNLSKKEKFSVPGAVKVPAGTLLISTVRPTRGAIAITQSSLHVSSAFCRLRLSNKFLFYLVCQPKFFTYLGENSMGGTYPTCRDETILNYEAFMPIDLKEQTAISTTLSDIDAEIAALQSRYDKIHNLKKSMIQQLLSGKTRLIKQKKTNA